ncbi:unannotated protein [freshwater metagenome]|uniref:Unannotated protein n=1 Tax=freshwater metagenome TaxID=449393 RepID=A0A6J6FMM3_9ZZZZ
MSLKDSRRCGNVRECTLARPTNAGSCIVCGKSSTTRWTRLWRDTVRQSASHFTPTAASRFTTRVEESRSTLNLARVFRASKWCSPNCTRVASSAPARTPHRVDCTVSERRWSTHSANASTSSSTVTDRPTRCRSIEVNPEHSTTQQDTGRARRSRPTSTTPSCASWAKRPKG